MCENSQSHSSWDRLTYLKGAAGSSLVSTDFWCSVLCQSLGLVACGSDFSLWIGLSFTHMTPSKSVWCSRGLVPWALMSLSHRSKFVPSTRCARSRPRAVAMRAPCFSSSSSAFGFADGNVVRKRRALVPVRTSWPRPLSMAEPPVVPGATPPTPQIVPWLTCRTGPSASWLSRVERTVPAVFTVSIVSLLVKSINRHTSASSRCAVRHRLCTCIGDHRTDNPPAVAESVLSGSIVSKNLLGRAELMGSLSNPKPLGSIGRRGSQRYEAIRSAQRTDSLTGDSDVGLTPREMDIVIGSTKGLRQART